MPLVDNAIYAIRNDLTHTVLDLSGDGNFARAWGWNGGYNQKWELIKVDANHWRLQNKLNPHRRFLSRQAANPAHRLVGGVADAHSTFRIERIPGPSERYRILHGGQAVTLIKGGGAEAVAHNILAVHHQVSDRHADGPPIALQAMVDTNHAQIWSFLPVAQLPVEDGTYRIVNQTGLILNSNGAGPGAYT
ncbi:hypothetical protein BYT27DRAFT_7186437 [Phlegmacium glaucopus]|nr:hypothetical protein BYT27DRAFT_7186437 [Phlegmacium glaucopus]